MVETGPVANIYVYKVGAKDVKLDAGDSSGARGRNEGAVKLG